VIAVLLWRFLAVGVAGPPLFVRRARVATVVGLLGLGLVLRVARRRRRARA
jgi:hypothetical protein